MPGASVWGRVHGYKTRFQCVRRGRWFRDPSRSKSIPSYSHYSPLLSPWLPPLAQLPAVLLLTTPSLPASSCSHSSDDAYNARVLKLALDIANGMKYVAGLRILHIDLKVGGAEILYSGIFPSSPFLIRMGVPPSRTRTHCCRIMKGPLSPSCPPSHLAAPPLNSRRTITGRERAPSEGARGGGHQGQWRHRQGGRLRTGTGGCAGMPQEPDPSCLLDFGLISQAWCGCG